MSTRLPRWPIVGVALAVLWLFLRGVTLATLLEELLIGLALGLPLAFVLRRFYEPSVTLGHDRRAPLYAVLYLLVFLKELLTANLDVSYRVLAPSMPIEPDVVAVPLRVETDLAVTTIANSITLTPGTLTMDYDQDANTLYVHAITGQNRSAVVAPIRTWEDYALIIFDEDGQPSDAPPSPTGGDRGSGGEARGR